MLKERISNFRQTFLFCFVFLITQNFGFSKDLDQNNSVSKGQILNIKTPTNNSGEFEYLFREGYAYGEPNQTKSALFDKVTKVNGIIESSGFDFENISLYVDNVFSNKDKIFIECHIIDKDGFLHKREDGSIQDAVYDKRFLVVDLKKSVDSGEIEITNDFYEEPYSIKQPKRAVERFVEENSTVTLVLITLIYVVFILLINMLSEKNRMNYEIQMGLVNDLEPRDFLKSDLNRYWLYRLHDANPKLGLLFWDWKKDESELMKGNAEYLKKYNISETQQVRDISKLISKIFKIEDLNNKFESDWLKKLRKNDSKTADVWSKWDKDVSKLMKSNQNMLQKLGLDDSEAAKNVEKIINKYGLKSEFEDPEIEKNLKLLIDYLKKVSNQGVTNSN